MAPKEMGIEVAKHITEKTISITRFDIFQNCQRTIVIYFENFDRLQKPFSVVTTYQKNRIVQLR